ncbi:SDR family NAD(P)-dependent oxidoreductase [Synechococcus sp. CS-1329]|uniref:SDR family NAD(P)-dependent oxidoreductase n=1 Tax=Synechococcus sp. CS-1329 TaxID=2847975 RepID=UPI00223B10CB|nr:SDR family NAD(P)-dependent oxidoreductase [Synechococcus sp. CS-1329]MCT0218049.1 SDR family NAD(P)-dependent oxidoreductase [Synechococcus sp. CS-1329]
MNENPEPSTIQPQPRRILITGASSGIGQQAALLLRRAGHRLCLPCRDQARADATRQALLKVNVTGGDGNSDDDGDLSTPLCDLADLESIERCTEVLLAAAEPIDGLVLNAGLQDSGASEPRRSAQGHELTIAVNHLGHQALAMRLLPLLERSETPRLVITASEVHDPSSSGGRVGQPAGLGDLAGLRAGAGFSMVDGQTPFSADKAYKDSKLCNLLFARELERQRRGSGRAMPVLAWSPGLVIPRNSGGFFRYSRQHNEWGQRLFALVARDLLRLTASPERAGALLAELATAPAYAAPGFSYHVNRVLAPGRLRFELTEPSPEARNDALAAELWTVSAQLLGL